jgi:polysaccharide pyruvyl transferase WcaK-like protein/glycosyltransferase involved in cell wall biosynthesis
MKYNCLLHGIWGVYNYGCEAIIRGTVALLKEMWPEAVVRYASPRPLEDKKRLGGCPVEIVTRELHSRYSVRHVVSKGLGKMGATWSPLIESLDYVRDADVVLSIGGDIYADYPPALVRFGEAVMDMGKSYVIWGASLSPDNEEQELSRKALSHLCRVDLITSREPRSTRFLNNRGLSENVVQCADPAYLVSIEDGVSAPHSRRLTIGVNLSPLSIKHSDPRVTIDRAAYAQGRALAHLVESLQAEIVLIPHVVCDSSERDDDLRYLKRIFISLPRSIRGRVSLAVEATSFREAKKLLRTCDIVLAARMHCAINAITEGVPTILLAYSPKAYGMAEYVYGDHKWALPIQAFDGASMTAAAEEMLLRRTELSRYLGRRVPKIKADARRAGQALATLLAQRTLSGPSQPGIGVRRRAEQPAIVMLRGTPVAPDPAVEKGARWATDAGWQVKVVAWDRDGTHLPLERRNGYEVVRIGIRAGFGVGLRNLAPLVAWQCALLWWLLTHARRIDVIKASDFDTVLPAILAATLLRKDYIYEIHDFYADSHHVPRALQKLVGKAEIWAARWAAVVLLPSESRIVQLAGCTPKRLAIICNTPEPVNGVQLYGSADTSEFLIGYVGVLSKLRGLRELLSVLERNPDWKLEIGGYGVDHPMIERQLRALPNVKFHGKVSIKQSLDIYSRAQVIICTYDPSVPNHRLASPNKLAEALMLGKPLITAEGTSVDKFVKMYDLGAVVPYGDCHALENALSFVASWSPETRSAFARRARQIYEEKFSWSAMRQRFIGVLSDVLLHTESASRVPSTSRS